MPTCPRRVDLRAQAISFFFAISQFFGGVIAPALFAALIGDAKNPTPLPLSMVSDLPSVAEPRRAATA